MVSRTRARYVQPQSLSLPCETSCVNLLCYHQEMLIMLVGGHLQNAMVMKRDLQMVLNASDFLGNVVLSSVFC